MSDPSQAEGLRDLKAEAQEAVGYAARMVLWANETNDPQKIAWAATIATAAWGMYWNVVGS